MKKSLSVRKPTLAQLKAPCAAADQIDRVVKGIVRALRQGKEARLPGLGTLIPGKEWALNQDAAQEEPNAEETHER